VCSKRFKYDDSIKVANEVVCEISQFCKFVQICGSVRRKKRDNGDIDIVIVPDDFVLLSQRLMDIGFKVYPTLAKRDFDISISIYFSELKYYGSMVLHFTGSNEFNRVMRDKANHLGMVLTQFGLYKDGDEIICKDEIDIFKELHMEYVDPINRI
jgi:DNA polymerase/3'-5' exonuclease PolX